MFRWIVLAFILVPLTELYLLIWLSDEIGFWETFAIAVCTGILGGNLARSEGLRVWKGWKQALERGQAPEDSLADGVLILVGGALLFTPGVLTDAVGFLMLFPSSRRPLAKFVRALFAQAIASKTAGGTVGFGGGAAPESSSRPRAGQARVARVTVVDTTGVETKAPPKTLESPDAQ